MLSVIKKGIIQSNKDYYLSFPDIVKSKQNHNYYLVYRSGNAHHPVSSSLCLFVSNDQCKTWNKMDSVGASLFSIGFVWNCPRFSFKENKKLVIFCDTKNHTEERKATFKIVSLDVDEHEQQAQLKNMSLTEINGMVPDRLVNFQNKVLFCVHKRDKHINNLIEIVYWSRDNGKTFHDCNLMAKEKDKDFCEASIVNYNDKCLYAYLRENTKQIRPMYLSKSLDGINWDKPKELSFYGHRPTVNVISKYEIMGTYRDTSQIAVCWFIHNLKTNKISTGIIDTERKENIFNFGYSSFVQLDIDLFYCVYYIKNTQQKPLIKYALLKRN